MVRFQLLRIAVVQSTELSRADIPCVLDNGAGEKTVTLYITVNVTPPTLYNTLPSIPAADDGSPAEEAPMPGLPQSPSPEHSLHLSHDQPVEAGNDKPQIREEVSPTSSAKDPGLLLDQADHAMKLVYQSNAEQGAVGTMTWVRDMFHPIAKVRAIPLYIHIYHFPNETLMLFSSGW